MPVLSSVITSASKVSLELPKPVTRDPSGHLQMNIGGYAFGLRVSQTCTFRHVVAHSGGLPGYGSQMRWLPEYGVGIASLNRATSHEIASRGVPLGA